MLGASALVALAVAGCGTAANQPKLHNSSEKRLLSLVARARADAAKHRGTAVHAVLGEFVSDVQTLTTSGQLSRSSAHRLAREARATAAQAAHELHPKAATTADASATTTQPATTITASTPAAGPTPATKTTANTPARPPVRQHNPRQGPHGPALTPPKPGPRHGHRHGHGGRPAGHGGAEKKNIARAWAKWPDGATGGGGD